MKKYNVILSHDKGKTRLYVMASTIEEAKQIVMKAENCPEGAIQIKEENTQPLNIGDKVKDLSGIEGTVIPGEYSPLVRVDFGNGNWRDLRGSQLTKVNDSEPLYKVLNEKRTQGDWANSGDIQIRHKQRSILIAQFHKHLECNMPAFEVTANALYTALAVNNLAPLADALATIQSVLKDWDNGTGKYKNLIEHADKALNRIS